MFEKTIYVYNLFVVGTPKTEIIKLNMDGSNPQNILTYEGLITGIDFYDGAIYFNAPNGNVDFFMAYELEDDGSLGARLNDREAYVNDKTNVNETALFNSVFALNHYGGVFYQKQQGENEETDVSYASLNGEIQEVTQYEKDLMITPYGYFKISSQNDKLTWQNLNGSEEEHLYISQSGELSIQLFTYDETGVYFCAFETDGGTLYRITRDDMEVQELFKLQDAGIKISNGNMTAETIYLNVQKSYSYIWNSIDSKPVRCKL